MVHKSHLLNGSSQSCGCIKIGVIPDVNKVKDLTGQRFGRLVVLSREGSFKSSKGKSRVQWKCLCDCGEYTNLHTQTPSKQETPQVVDVSVLRVGSLTICTILDLIISGPACVQGVILLTRNITNGME